MMSDDPQTPKIPDLPAGADGAAGGIGEIAAVDEVAVAEVAAIPEEEVKGFDAATERKQVRREKIGLLLKSPGFVFGAGILTFWILCAIVPGIFTTYGAQEAVRVDGSVIARVGPRMNAWFGTDTIGNDVFARVIYGARPVLVTAVVAALLAVAVGTMLGLITGYFGGWIDEVISRVIEALLSIPVILLAIMVLQVFGKSTAVIILTIATLFIPVVTRTIRSAVLAEVRLDYVTSSKLRGENSLFVMTREILPNITGVAIVELTVRVGYAIFTVATLSFLGLNAGDSSAADWGRDLGKQYRIVTSGQWWAAIFPALAIASLVIAVNLIADSLERVNKS